MSRAAFAALWLLVFTIPWENAVTLPGLGTLNRAIGVAAVVSGLFSVLARGHIRAPRGFLLAAILFLAWSALTLFWTIDAEASTVRVKTYAQLVTMAWLVWEVADSEARQAHLLRAFVLGSWYIAGVIIWQYLNGATPIDQRYTVEGFNANDLALTLVLGMPMAWYLAVAYRSSVFRWIERLYIPVALVALLLTASRGAFVAAIAALSLIPWTLGRIDWRSKLALSVIVAISIYALALVVPASSWERIATTQSELTTGTISFRARIWGAGWDVFLTHPVVGVGAGTFAPSVAPQLARPYAAHNAFLAVLVEQGVIGLVLFAGVFLAAFITSRHAPTLTTRFRMVLLATLIIGVMPANWDYVKITWFVLGLLASQGALVAAERRRSQAWNAYSPMRTFGTNVRGVMSAGTGDA